MTEFFLIQVLLFLGLALMIVGGVGVVTGTPIVHQSPIHFNRPIIYILVAVLIFFQTIVNTVGPYSTFALLTILLLYLTYEMARPFLVSSIQLTGVTPDIIANDLRHALSQLGLTYQGQFPHYRVVEPRAIIDVRYSKRLDQGQLRIWPASAHSLLKQIHQIIDKDFNQEEQARAPRVYILDVVLGAILFTLALWQLAVKTET